MWSTTSWIIEHWYWLVLLGLLVFAWGYFHNWSRERRWKYFTDTELGALLGAELHQRETADRKADPLVETATPTSIVKPTRTKA